MIKSTIMYGVCHDSNQELYSGIIKAKKPPLGLIPKRFHDEKRLKEIIEAIKRCIDNELPFPIDIEWVEEYNKLCQKTPKL